MKLGIAAGCVLLVVIGLSAEGQVRRRAASPGGVAYDWTALDLKLREQVPARVSGLTFILERRGATLHSVALGNQTMSSVLPIASSSKAPSALAILTLVDEGKLDLDRPIRDYIGTRVDWPDDKAAITTRMLLNHLSGLPDAPCLDDRSTTLRDCTQQIARTALQFAPGSKFYYGGSSIQVAGFVAETIAGKSWNAFFSERIASPLGLTRFTYMVTANPRIAGGAFSDAGDYDRILRMTRDGGTWNGRTILSPATLLESERDQVAGIPKAYTPGGTTLPGYSFGWWHTDPQLHPGSAGPELSDQGAFGCTPWIDLDLGYTAVLLINDRATTGTAIWNAIRPLIIEQLKR